MGLIPARAGKTWVTASVSPSGKAHPRSRGENIAFTPSHACDQGSSPLARGKHRLHAFPRLRPGLIPARAGKTYTPASPPTTSQAHPRSRGENRHSHAGGQRVAGSSPLARGKPLLTRSSNQAHRLIPARAGKTWSTQACADATTAHPRSRGENVPLLELLPSEVGSSPLARGKRDDQVKQRIQDGLIPARAGKTLRNLRFCHADRSDLGNP